MSKTLGPDFFQSLSFMQQESQTNLQQENVRNIHAKEIKCSYVMCLS